MKNLILFLSVSSIIFSCKNSQDPQPEGQVVANVQPSNDLLNLGASPTNPNAKTAAPSTDPVIQGISASLGGGKKFFINDTDYSNYLQANNEGTSTVTITGINFGASAGAVKVDGGYSVTNIKWSPTKITGTLNCAATSVAGNIAFSVTTTDKKVSYFNKLLCPFLKSRRFGQCTFHGTADRIIRNLTVPSTAHEKTADNTGSYLAQAGDILHWSGVHQASVASVTQDGKNKNLYSFTVTEMDGYVGNGAIGSHIFTIEFNRDKDGKIISKKSGNYYSKIYNKTAASSYYR
jgi:hypothetical protein